MVVEPVEDKTILLTGPITVYEVATIRERIKQEIAKETKSHINYVSAATTTSRGTWVAANSFGVMPLTVLNHMQK